MKHIFVLMLLFPLSSQAIKERYRLVPGFDEGKRSVNTYQRSLNENLLQALYQRDVQRFQKLLMAGANPNTKHRFTREPILTTAVFLFSPATEENNEILQIIKDLLQAGANPYLPDVFLGSSYQVAKKLKYDVLVALFEKKKK